MQISIHKEGRNKKHNQKNIYIKINYCTKKIRKVKQNKNIYSQALYSEYTNII